MIDRVRGNVELSDAVLDSLRADGDLSQRTTARIELQRLARRLGRRELQVLLLSRVDGLTHDEIGALLKVSDRTVRRVLAKTDAKLENLKEK